MAELIDIKAHRKPRPKETLSQHKVDTAQPRAARYSIHDASLPGFQLRVSPGGSRAYYLHTRIGKGRTARQAWIHIGDAAVLKLREAREKAKGMLVETRDGGDPVRRLAAEEQVFALLDRYEASLKTRGVVKQSEVMRSLRGGLDRYRKDRLTDLNRATFAGIMNSLDADGLPGAADYFRKSASAFLNWCVNNGLLHASPLAGYRREKITRRQLIAADQFTMKTAAEIKRFWDATARANPNLRDYLRFLLLTGQRRTETALMRWRDVDLDRGIWEIPAEHSKTGAAHTVYLAAESLDAAALTAPLCGHRIGVSGPQLQADVGLVEND